MKCPKELCCIGNFCWVEVCDADKDLIWVDAKCDLLYCDSAESKLRRLDAQWVLFCFVFTILQ